MKEEYLNERMETMPPGELRALQEQKFLKQLDYVWQRSVLYQDKFRGHGVERSDKKTLGDLSKLPFTEKDELRKSQEEHPPLGNHVVASLEDIIRLHSSSGTTGVPTFVGITAHDQQVWTQITGRVPYYAFL